MSINELVAVGVAGAYDCIPLEDWEEAPDYLWF